MQVIIGTKCDIRYRVNFTEKQMRIITAVAFIKGVSKSKAIRIAVDGLMDDLPKYAEKELLDKWDIMTEEQRKYPGK